MSGLPTTAAAPRGKANISHMAGTCTQEGEGSVGGCTSQIDDDVANALAACSLGTDLEAGIWELCLNLNN